MPSPLNRSQVRGHQASNHIPAFPPPPDGIPERLLLEAEHRHRPCLQDIRPAYFYPDIPTCSFDCWDGVGVPVFEPTMEQFENFYAFTMAIDRWGSRAGLAKVIPPVQWKEEQYPSVRRADMVRSRCGIAAETFSLEAVRLLGAIEQNFISAGSGIWHQKNVLKDQCYDACTWAQESRTPKRRPPELPPLIRKLAMSTDYREDPAPFAFRVSVIGSRTRSGRVGSQPKKQPDVSLSSHSPADIRPDPGYLGSHPEAFRQPRHRRSQSAAGHLEPLAVQCARQANSCFEDLSNAMDELQNLFTDDDDLALASTKTRRQRPRARSMEAVGRRSCSPKARDQWEEPLATQLSCPADILADQTSEEDWLAFDHLNAWRAEGGCFESPRSQALRQGNSKLASDLSDDSTEIFVPTLEDYSPDVCQQLEGHYWGSMTIGTPPIYGADQEGTLFTDRTRDWNLRHLGDLLTRLNIQHRLPGVTTPYLYFGQWRSTFAWHVEDMDLYSINFLHFGAPKQWFSIRQDDRVRFETIMQTAFPSDARKCPQFLRHKSYIASPSYLAARGVQPSRLVQRPGEFVLTYPKGYHSGYNLGYNCAEAVNFAIEPWVTIGRRAKWCGCEEDTVRFDLDTLLFEAEAAHAAKRMSSFVPDQIMSRLAPSPQDLFDLPPDLPEHRSPTPREIKLWAEAKQRVLLGRSQLEAKVNRALQLDNFVNVNDVCELAIAVRRAERAISRVERRVGTCDLGTTEQVTQLRKPQTGKLKRKGRHVHTARSKRSRGEQHSPDCSSPDKVAELSSPDGCPDGCGPERPCS